MTLDAQSEPRRWLEDPDAPEDLRAALDAVRAAPAPRLDEAAGLLALQQRIRSSGGGSGGSSGSSTTTAATTSTTTGTMTAGTLQGAAIAVGLATAIGLGSWLASGGDEPPPRTSSSPPPAATESAPPASPAEPTGEPTPADPEPVHPELADAEPATPPPDESETSPRGEAAAGPRLSRDERLRREMQLLDEARRAVDRDPRAALSALATARREIGSGTFDDERDALRALALFGLHRDAEARPLAERILRRDPHGLYAARLRDALASSP